MNFSTYNYEYQKWLLSKNMTDEEKEKLTPEALSPVYLRASQAEREREEKLKSQNN